MTIKHSARLAAYLIILGLAAWDIYLLTIGLPWTGYSETFPSTPGLTSTIVFMPYQPALYSLVALLPIAIGLSRDKWLPFTWAGLLLHLIVGGLLLFSLGLLYIPIIGLLAVVVGVVQRQVSHQARWLLASAGGVGVVLLVGLLLSYSAFGVALLVMGGLLALGLLAIWRIWPRQLGA